jgi:hypothetical protein
MITCARIREKLSAYLEGVLLPEEKKLMGDHLASCEACAEALRELKRTGELVGRLEEVEPPPWLKQRIMARVREGSEEKKGIMERLFYPLRIKIPVQVFATLTVAVLVLYVYKGMEPEMKVTPVPPATIQVLPEGQETRRPGKAIPEIPVPPVPSSGAAKGKDLPGVTKTAPMEPAQVPGKLKEAEGLKREEGAVAGGVSSRDSLEKKVVRPAQQLKAASAEKQAQLGIVLYVVDPTAAAKDAEKLLRLLGAENVRREFLGGVETVKGVLVASKITELFEKLNGMGKVRETDAPSRTFSGDVTVTIEIAARE